MRLICPIALALLWLALPLQALSKNDLTDTQANALQSLNQRSVIVLMRHALAPGTGDPARFDLQDCSSQRNLNERGRQQARRTGQILRAQGIAFDQIWTSQWCRCQDTATLLGLGPVTEVPAFNSFFADMSAEPLARQAMLERLATLPADQRVLVITHYVNIRALTGIAPRSGELIVAKRLPDGGIEVMEPLLLAR
ncbi:MAG: hypothetical protein Alpg2KO_14800 [Alphaproteobacteria bacterium]